MELMNSRRKHYVPKIGRKNPEVEQLNWEKNHLIAFFIKETRKKGWENHDAKAKS